jgi:TonB family protein
VHKVQPVYPEKARRAGIQGTIVMCASIGKDGKIKSLRPVSGPKELVPAAMKAVKKWRYAPFQVNNKTVDVETDIRVIFALTR